MGAETQPLRTSNSFAGAALVGARDREPVPRWKVWASRLWIVLVVVFSICLGMVLVKLPWTMAWNQNALLANFPSVRAFLQHNFVRGISTGLGVIDIWIGVSAAVRYRDPGKR